MREILYRGKRADNSEWVYGNLYLLFGRPVIKFGESDTETVGVLPESVGEYTGLLDKHGAKIFEGDILKFVDDYGVWCASVIFERGLFGIDVYNVKQITNPEKWDKEYPITKSRGFGCAWGYEEFGTAHSYRKPLAQATLYKGRDEKWEDSEYYKLHTKHGWGNYIITSAEIIGNTTNNPEILEAQK